MTTDELYDLVLIETAEYIPEELEVDKTQFLKVVEHHVLKEIGRYKPNSRVTWLQLTTSPYIFVEDIPDWISDIGIAMSNQAVSMASVIPSMFRQDHRTRLWYYDRPMLYTFMFGLLQVMCCYYPHLELESGDCYTIEDLDMNAHDPLIKLTSGYWLVSVGMSRRKANFVDIGVNFDSDALVAEGKRMIDEVTGSFSRQNNAWWLAVS